MTQEELSYLQRYLDFKVKNGTIKRMHADDIYDLMKVHCWEPPVNKDCNDWINDLVCNIDECCTRNDEGLSDSQFMWTEESLARDLKSIWNQARFNENAKVIQTSLNRIAQLATDRKNLNGVVMTAKECLAEIAAKARECRAYIEKYCLT